MHSHVPVTKQRSNNSILLQETDRTGDTSITGGASGLGKEFYKIRWDS